MAAFLFHHETTLWKLGCYLFLCGGSLEQHFLYASPRVSRWDYEEQPFVIFYRWCTLRFMRDAYVTTLSIQTVDQRWARLFTFVWLRGRGALRSSDTTETNRSAWRAELQRDLTKISGPEMTVHGRTATSRLNEATALTSQWNWY